MAYATVTVCVLVGARVTVNVAVAVPLLPSVTLALPIVSVGAACTVMELLVASLVHPPLANHRT